MRLVVLWAAGWLAVLVLCGNAAFYYREHPPSWPGANAQPSQEQVLAERVTALETEIARLKKELAPNPMAGYNEVYVNGEFAGFKKQEGIIQGIWAPGYVEQPLSQEFAPGSLAARVMAGPGH